MWSTARKPDRRASLRGRLMLLLIAGSALVWAAIAAATFVDARRHAGQLFDAQLTEYSEVLSAIAGHEAYEMAGDTLGADHEFGEACTYQVFAPNGFLLLRSHAAPATPLAASDGFSDSTVDGKRWRTFRRHDRDNQLTVIVAHALDEREAMVAGFARRLLLPLLVGLPLLAVAVWVGVSRSLAPLDRLTGELRHREAARLEPLRAEDVPREVEPLVRAMNELFARVEQSFENERRFTGDAAHELRTPLAALRTHAEVALTTARDERRQRSLEQVVAGVDRASRLVEQLLALARLDASRAVRLESLDANMLVGEAVAASREDAAARAVRMRFTTTGEVRLKGDAAMLQVMLRNLLENAIRHAGPEGEVRLAVRTAGDGRVELEIEDSGPGVPAALRERIFDRHFRAPGGGGAAGLGLSIARRVADLHGGAIEAGAGRELSGLRIVVSLAAADKDSLRRATQSGPVTRQETPT